jgi:hypothetical protein
LPDFLTLFLCGDLLGMTTLSLVDRHMGLVQIP